MKPLPLPLRVAAGLAVTTAERVRELPKQLTGLPVTVVSQVLQFSMRVQQQVTELAIKGDDVLSALRPVEDTPSWATFDEDLPADLGDRRDEREADVVPLREATVPEQRAETNGHPRDLADLEQLTDDPWAEEERALAEDHADGEFDSTATPPVVSGPAGLTDYDLLTLPQLRARLRRFDLPQLEELLTYERANADRPSFVGMLARRIGNVKKAESDGGDSAEGQ